MVLTRRTRCCRVFRHYQPFMVAIWGEGGGGGRRRRDAGKASVQHTKDTKQEPCHPSPGLYYTPTAVLCFGAPATKRDRSPTTIHTRIRFIEVGGWEDSGHGQGVSCTNKKQTARKANLPTVPTAVGGNFSWAIRRPISYFQWLSTQDFHSLIETLRSLFNLTNPRFDRLIVSQFLDFVDFYVHSIFFHTYRNFRKYERIKNKTAEFDRRVWCTFLGTERIFI